MFTYIHVMCSCPGPMSVQLTSLDALGMHDECCGCPWLANTPNGKAASVSLHDSFLKHMRTTISPCAENTSTTVGPANKKNEQK